MEVIDIEIDLTSTVKCVMCWSTTDSKDPLLVGEPLAACSVLCVRVLR